jgi:ubiquinone/menaquinone biosynthesis C-methylase UbiE
MIKARPDFGDRIDVECVDIDRSAIAKGEELLKAENIKHVSFVESNMAKLHGRYQKNVDYGLLIGVLCGMTFRERVSLLTVLRRYFKPGSKLVAAALLDRMAEEDLLCSYILRETAGWVLQFRPLGELKQVFEAAGWVYEGYFQEEPTRFYEIGIGAAP